MVWRPLRPKIGVMNTTEVFLTVLQASQAFGLKGLYMSIYLRINQLFFLLSFRTGSI
jgi:hypothetical protein